MDGNIPVLSHIFIGLVADEIKALKNHCTIEELNKLNIIFFNYNCVHNCIYGQLTGYNRSERAIELKSLCNVIFGRGYVNRDDVWPVSDISQIFSPLEIFIFKYPQYANEIIFYLKGNYKFDFKKLYWVIPVKY